MTKVHLPSPAHTCSQTHDCIVPGRAVHAYHQPQACIAPYVLDTTDCVAPPQQACTYTCIDMHAKEKPDRGKLSAPAAKNFVTVLPHVCQSHRSFQARDNLVHISCILVAACRRVVPFLYDSRQVGIAVDGLPMSSQHNTSPNQQGVVSNLRRTAYQSPPVHHELLTASAHLKQPLRVSLRLLIHKVTEGPPDKSASIACIPGGCHDRYSMLSQIY
jgi:hypothetical protein